MKDQKDIQKEIDKAIYDLQGVRAENRLLFKSIRRRPNKVASDIRMIKHSEKIEKDVGRIYELLVMLSYDIDSDDENGLKNF